MLLDPLDVLHPIRMISEVFKAGTWPLLSYRFDGVAHDISVNYNVALLPYSVDTVHSLRFNHWVPVRFNQMYMIGDGQIDP